MNKLPFSRYYFVSDEASWWRGTWLTRIWAGVSAADDRFRAALSPGSVLRVGGLALSRQTGQSRSAASLKTQICKPGEGDLSSVGLNDQALAGRPASVEPRPIQEAISCFRATGDFNLSGCKKGGKWLMSAAKPGRRFRRLPGFLFWPPSGPSSPSLLVCAAVPVCEPSLPPGSRGVDSRRE